MSKSPGRRMRARGAMNLFLATCLAVLATTAAVATPALAASAHAAAMHQPGVSRQWASVHRHLRSARRSRHSAHVKLRRCEHRHPHALYRCSLRLAAYRVATRRLQIVHARVRGDRVRLLAYMARTAPAVAATGDTVKWSRVPTVKSYVFVRKVPGNGETYSVVHGTSVTPPAVEGATVQYTVRTAVSGSRWAPTVTITYPKGKGKGREPHQQPPEAEQSGSGTESSGSTSSTSPQLSSQAFQLGMIPETLSSEEPSTIAGLGARTVRMEFEINAPVSELEGVIGEYAQAGIRVLPLAGFESRLPSAQEAQNLGRWAAAFGPGGTFWQGKPYPSSVAVTDIEFGNETSYSYQWNDNSTEAVASRAQTYAHRFQAAYEAMHSANANVGLLAQADDGDSGSSTWVENMFAAVPSLGQMVAGWTIHPYGPEWEARINRLISQTNAVGASSSIPIYVTEWGLATDNGSCLNNNYGWNPCMTYAEAASVVRNAIDGMRARYGSRLAALYLYQAQDQAPPGASNNREEYFGVLQNDGAPKGEYTAAVESLLAESP